MTCALGGALFCARRYDRMFANHDGAQSYHAARAQRLALRRNVHPLSGSPDSSLRREGQVRTSPIGALRILARSVP